MKRYRIRKCDGNKDAWLLAACRDDGSEMGSHGAFTTAMSLASLIEYAGHLRPKTGDVVQFETDAQFLGEFLEVEILKERLARLEAAVDRAAACLPLLRR